MFFDNVCKISAVPDSQIVIQTAESIGFEKFQQIQEQAIFCSKIYYFEASLWNSFLAILPAIISFFLHKYWEKLKFSKYIWMAVLLALIPNSVYLFSNFIEFNLISNSDMVIIPSLKFGEIANWQAFGVLFLIGSLSFFYCTKKLFSFIKLNFLIKTLYFLAIGLAIYLGEFGRFNSWQIFDLVGIFTFLAQANLIFMLQYILVWSLICYLIFVFTNIWHTKYF